MKMVYTFNNVNKGRLGFDFFFISFNFDFFCSIKSCFVIQNWVLKVFLYFWVKK
jgi:hypothetical protein